MYRPWGCCCFCAPVKEGTIALAFFNLVGGFIGSVLTLVILIQGEPLHAIANIEKIEDCDDECNSKLPFWGAASAFTNVVFTVSLFLCALPFVFGVVAFKTRPRLLIPYLVWLIFSTPLDLPDYIFTYYTLKSLRISSGVALTIMVVAGTLTILVRAHFFIVVREFQKQEMTGPEVGVDHPHEETGGTQPLSHMGSNPEPLNDPTVQGDRNILYFGGQPPPYVMEPSAPRNEPHSAPRMEPHSAAKMEPHPTRADPPPYDAAFKALRETTTPVDS